MRKIFLFASAIFFLTCDVAGQNKTDSLIKAIGDENDIAKRVDLIFQLCEGYRNTNPDSSRLYARKAIEFSQLLNDRERISKGEWYLTHYYYLTGRSDSALAICDENIAWLKDQPGLQPLLAKFYTVSGLSCMKLDRKKEAIDRFYMALQTAEKCNDIKTQLNAYVNIGWAMMELNRFEEAVVNFYKAIAFIQKNKLREVNPSVIYNNLASSYASLNKADSAYKYANIAIEKGREHHDIVNEANGLFILGEAQKQMGRLEDALQSYLKGKSLREQSGKPDPFFTVSDLAELSVLYSKLNKTAEGIAAAQEALEIALKNNISAKLPMIYEALASNYEVGKDFEKAAAIYKKISELKDSLYKDANPKALAEMQTKYETEHNQRIIEKQKDKIARQNILFVGLGLLMITISWLAWSIYKRYKLRKESQFHAEMMKQRELAAKAVIKAEEEERQRIARDLHDGVGQMMSAAKMNLSAFESEMKFNNTDQKLSFEKIIELVDDSCKEVRQVSHNMMPNSLLKNSLASALQDFLNKIDKKKIDIHLYTEGLNQRIDSNVESVLYRVIQECVNNVIKHSSATTLDISLIRDKDGISATIEDNGRGFDINDKEKFEGIGLRNIRTRIEYLKGAVEFDSSPGRGTAIGLHVHLENGITN